MHFHCVKVLHSVHLSCMVVDVQECYPITFMYTCTCTFIYWAYIGIHVHVHWLFVISVVHSLWFDYSDMLYLNEIHFWFVPAVSHIANWL